jgi:hypothetical protein
LEKAYAAGKLRFFGALQPLHDPPAFADYLAPLASISTRSNSVNTMSAFGDEFRAQAN